MADVDRHAQFQAFCGVGRLAGTPGNAAAARFLEDALKNQGYEAIADPDRRRAFVPLSWCLGLAVLALLGWMVSGMESYLVTAALFSGSMMRAAWYISRGVPLAIFGVRPRPGVVGPLPTVILGAHFDSASMPARASYLVANFLVVLIVAAFLVLGDLTSDVVAILAAAAFSLYRFPGNSSPGADDNASGVFTVLECARLLKDAGGVNIIPVFFNFEEEGLFGSGGWFAKRLSRRGIGIPGVTVDREKAFMINFDCVGRGGKVFVSGAKSLQGMLLGTAAAREAAALATSFYPSDHVSFRRPWQAVSFARANRYWALDLGWLHSRADVVEGVRLSHIDEISRIVEEFVARVSVAEKVSGGNP